MTAAVIRSFSSFWCTD